LRRIHEDGDESAREQLAQEMMPLARMLASRYSGRGEPLDDLVQVACIGVMKSIDGFDITRDVRFSSYATPTILGEIKRYFRDKSWSVRVPRGLQELQLQIARRRDELSARLGRAPTVSELAEDVGAPVQSVLDAIQSTRARRSRSLDEPLGEGGSLADQIGGEDPELGRAEMRVLIGEVFVALGERDRAILRMRFGDDLTQAEIAARIGLSQMQVSRIIRNSIAKLRLQVAA
jgi:RNA polymerase sigma-B factor